MIKIEDLKCPICGERMSGCAFEIDSNLSDSYGMVYKVAFKCVRCNTFLTTYSPMNCGGVISND